jgi:transient receptor potential cation channel subfamily A protein 1
VTAVNVTLAWLNLLGDVRELPFLGIYVIMFFDILKTFLRFGIIFLIFIIAFGLGFHLLLVNQEPFEYVGGSLIKTAVMMIGI